MDPRFLERGFICIMGVGGGGGVCVWGGGGGRFSHLISSFLNITKDWKGA